MRKYPNNVLIKAIVFIIATFSILPITYGQQCRLKIGMNIASLESWGSEHPFVNIMRSCSEWLTADSQWFDGAEWNTGVIDSIPKDEQGYPLELPYNVAGQRTPQIVFTIWDNSKALPQGDYICLYDGEGEIDFSFDAQIKSQSGNRIVVSVKSSANIVQLVIKRSAKGNHVRNIRFLIPGSESTYLVQPYNPMWLERLSPFKAIRFMDWFKTNNSPNVHWEDRAKDDYYTWTTAKGAPYEEACKLCNTLQADAWVNVPHGADTGYIRNMAIFMRDNIDPQLKIYVEYSNEIWNWMFDQTDSLYSWGDHSVEWPERIVPFIQRVMDIWTDVFKDQKDRLVRVVGGQHYWTDVSCRIALNMRPGSFDAFASAGYISLGEEGYAKAAEKGASLTTDDVIQYTREEIARKALPQLRELKEQICDVRHVRLLIYEGGQHIVSDPFGTDQPYNQVLEDVQSLPAMYDLYNDWLDTLRNLTDNLLFMHFSFVCPKDGKYGSWGALEYMDQDINDAPKYRALIDNQCGSNEVNTARNTNLTPVEIQLNQNYPNPFNPSTKITYSITGKADYVSLNVYDILGRRVVTLYNGVQSPGDYEIEWNGKNAAGQQVSSGVYFYQLRAGGNRAATKKMIILQ
jgi:hypothetical protein